MCSERVRHLEQALRAIIAAVGQRGLSVNDICAQAIGGLMTDRYRGWVNPDHKHGAADEIDKALVLLLSKKCSSDSNGENSAARDLLLDESV